MTSGAPVTVAVVTWNSAAVLPGLVASLRAGAGDVPHHLVVVDNASSDDTVALVRALSPEATVVQTGRNAGYAAAVNAAVAATPEAPAVLVLNPDVRLAPGCLPLLVAALDRPGTGIAVPRLVDGDGELVLSMRRRPTLLRAYADALVGASRAGRWPALGEVVSDPALYADDARPDWAEGSTQLVSRACLDASGAWDESFFLYSEETDFHLRAGDRGFGVQYVAAASATHLEGDSGTSPRLWALLTANRLRFFARRSSRPAAALYWLALVLRESTRAVRGDAIARAAVGVLVRPALLRAPRGPAWLDRVGARSAGAPRSAPRRSVVPALRQSVDGLRDRRRSSQ
ncbi:glycosyltransferase family 2 protein [Nocardioides sp. zg-1308]|uniref:glycosyltransferase family 2 protein n=1 Tax=Nocardioides TaxID=1839 RepID=UPI001553B5B8|nr:MULTISPECIES: glycosyltransferase family 2 protein [unclassified Nocardioides]NPD03665.1 glycosyltransferase family 2 protein [Nocardioides sp. zg-1308]WQQ21547.1 glycosyltransferase family 2 protein [Nocardioides sp. S-34]